MEYQNNSIQEEIEEISNMSELFEDECKSDFFKGATETEIQHFEHKNKIIIPESYKSWLRFSDGGEIFNTLVQFYGVAHKPFIKASYLDLPEDLVCIGSYIGDGQYVCFSKAKGNIVRFDHGEIMVIDSLKTFLRENIIDFAKRELKG